MNAYRLAGMSACLALLAGCAGEGGDPALCVDEDLPLSALHGYRLALHAGDSLVVVSDTMVREVPNARGLDTFAWAADGEGIFFTRGDSLFRSDLSGEAPSSLLGSWAQVRFPAASPDGSRLAVSVNETGDIGEGWEIVLIDLGDGSRTPLGHGYGPSWSADSRTLYYEIHSPVVRLARREVDGGGPESLSLEHDRDRTVTVSPDGASIVFTRGLGSLMLHSFTEHATLRLTADLPHDRYGTFSPDGAIVAYYRLDESDGVHMSIVACQLSTGRTAIFAEGMVRGAAFGPAS